ncbi:SWIM zinc finger domain-containing protein [Streptomyces sp. NPDC051567]|uniref:SWIM zinc finger domain-containing protein n=1 Tax=Streptomyces sp. NPDC051567 TaxID=3365660 RepID=UPI0037A8F272
MGRLRADGDHVTATVTGTERYRVVLRTTGSLRATCDCPYGADGFFCKHCVAVALTLLNDPGREGALRKEAVDREAALNTWLGGLDRDGLLTLVRARMAQDEDFKEALTLRARTASGDTAAAVAAVRELADPSGFLRYGYIGYEDAAGYAARLVRAARAIGDLSESGRPDAAFASAREAISRVAEVYESADDSDGAIAEAAGLLVDAHLDACRAGSPDPDETAGWIAGHCLAEDRQWIEIDPLAYAGVLGDRGLETLRFLAEEAFQRHPSGWAEKYLRGRVNRKRAAVPRTRTGTRTGTGAGPGTGRAADTAPDTTIRTLIGGLIAAGDLDAAWTEAEKNGLPAPAAAPEHLLGLADASAASRPKEALRVYLAVIESRSQYTGDSAYREIAELLAKARDCHGTLGTLDTFAAYLAALRTTYRRRRNLLRALDQRGL